MNPIVVQVTQDQLKKRVPDFRAGDTIRVNVRIIEGDKERVQKFEGVCIARHGRGLDETFTVRRISFGVGMERIFPLHSPRVESITVIRHGHVRRSKLYFLRRLTGKKARLPESRRKRLGKGAMIEVALEEEPPTPVEPKISEAGISPPQPPEAAEASDKMSDAESSAEPETPPTKETAGESGEQV